MEINLRKANAIQAEIKRAISSVEMKDTIDVSEYCADVGAEMVNAQDEYRTAVFKKQALTDALYNIRKSVATANAVAGVSVILGEVEAIDAKIKIYESVTASRSKMVSLDEMTKRLEKIRTMPAENTRVYGRTDSVTTGVVGKDFIEEMKNRIKQLRKQKQEIQDKLLSINVNTLVSISEADAKVLGFEGIL